LLFFSSTAQAKVGVSPATRDFSDLVQNVEVEGVVNFSRADASTDQRVSVAVYGEATPYVELTDGEMIILPQGEHLTPYTFTVKTGSLDVGSYKAKLIVSETSGEADVSVEGEGDANNKTGAGGSGLLAGAAADIIINVTDKRVEKFEIIDAQVDDVEAQQVLGFNYLIKNEGNVDTKPNQIVFRAVDTEDRTNYYEETFIRDQIPFIKAFAQEDVALETKAELGVGRYKITLDFYNKAGEIVFTKEVYLNISKKGALGQEGDLFSFTVDKAEYQRNEPVKLEAKFKNTGGSALTSVLKIDIFRDNQKIELIKSEPKYSRKGQTVVYEEVYYPQETGTYRAVAEVSYGAKITDQIFANFEVKETNLYLLIGMLALMTGLFALILILFYRRKKKKDEDESEIGDNVVT